MIVAPADILATIESVFPGARITRQSRGYRVGAKSGISIRDDGVYYDFSTATGGDIVELVRRELTLDYRAAFELLRAHGWYDDDKPTQSTPRALSPDDNEFLKDVINGLEVIERVQSPTFLDEAAYKLRRREFQQVTGIPWPYRLGACDRTIRTPKR